MFLLLDFLFSLDEIIVIVDDGSTLSEPIGINDLRFLLLLPPPIDGLCL